MTSMYEYLASHYNENVLVQEYCKIAEKKFYEKYGRKFPDYISHFEIQFLDLVRNDLDLIA